MYTKIRHSIYGYALFVIIKNYDKINTIYKIDYKNYEIIPFIMRGCN